MPRNDETLEDSKLRFRSVVAIVAAIVSMGGIGGTGIWKAAFILADLRRDVQDLRRQSEADRAGSFSMDRASEVALRMAIENPGTRIPNPRDPSQVIVVTSGRVSNVAGDKP
jgi:hypothetical protein